MKIAIVGTGNVGGALGKRWVATGHEVHFGVRNPSKPEVMALLKEIGDGASAKSVAEACALGEVVVLTTPWAAAEDAITSAGALSGKPLIDCTNPVNPDLSGLTIGHTTSAGEQVAEWAKNARVAKCFNTTGANNMANSKYEEGRIVMFVAGDDESVKQIAIELGEGAGFEMVDAGPLAMARLLEPLAMLWIRLAYNEGLGREFAFKLMRR